MTYNPPDKLPPYSVGPAPTMASGAPSLGQPIPATPGVMTSPTPVTSPFNPGGGFSGNDVLEQIFQKMGV